MSAKKDGNQKQATLFADDNFRVGKVPDRLFGSLVEHLGRCVYTGIYEPGHPKADEHGFRKDVLQLVRELGVTTIRYPGGNFVSGYRWEDGVGPQGERPHRLDSAWHSKETNKFGLHEMSAWLEEAGGNELMEAVNLGTRGLQEALDLLEYSNVPDGTRLSDQRIRNGHREPFNIKMWCLGNEMDGPWQMGHIDALSYGRLAAKTAAGMRQIDPSIELVVCGSSTHDMPTFGEWEQTVLDQTYDLIDFVSCHAYFKPVNGDIQSFLASGVDMDRFINDVYSIIASTKAKRHSKHDVFLSFDEWNVWYEANEPAHNPAGIDNWPVAPRLLEQLYSAADAVVVGDLLISLLKNVNHVHAASLAQLVNVIAPIVTEPGGAAWRQTIFYPFSQVASTVKKGVVLLPCLDSSEMNTDLYGSVDIVNAVAVVCHDGSLIIFAVNRSINDPIKFSVNLPSAMHLNAVYAQTLHEDDISAKNTLHDPNRVVPHENSSVVIDSQGFNICLPPVSWSIVHVY
ncbi:alpha-N-arabinofuranosidase [Bifidobacterium bombi]|uniref:non-reducing end alpha-L-arabinofuranosidase n=1 Tax=Bifidobacterium bombi DSM 19703 TaxID=1341695 RepID=A0A086BP86_9BIFI|nr:alpha-L-arabinofuranosidase C-terminal domain-containing protein [Bifidobacterium bombi]KFF30750.1 alpha-L-arabinosidase [Bifidobacterium bombi DSM 19703]